MVRGQCANLARMPGLHPCTFSKDILGFLMTTESQDLGLTSHPKDSDFYNIVSPSLHWGVRTKTDHSVSECEFSPEVSHPDTDQAQPCSASVGNQSWAAG